MWYLVSRDVYLFRQQLSKWLALFSILISIQKRKQNKSVIAGIYFKNWKDRLESQCQFPDVINI